MKAAERDTRSDFITSFDDDENGKAKRGDASREGFIISLIAQAIREPSQSSYSKSISRVIDTEKSSWNDLNSLVHRCHLFVHTYMKIAGHRLSGNGPRKDVGN